MAIPPRGNNAVATYFITTSSWEKTNLLQSDRMARLLIEVLYGYRNQKKFLLHEFVVMPNHLHALITPLPLTTLEKAVQLIKGGFSFRAKRELGIHSVIWQTSFHDRRVRDAAEYEKFRQYIWQNPVTARLSDATGGFPFSSASGKFELDEVPQRLKPLISSASMQG